MAKGHRTSLFVFLLLAIVLVVVGVEWTDSNDQPVVPAPKKSSRATAKPVLVDEQPLQTAQRFRKYVGSKEEDDFSREAIRLADHELDLAFNTGLRQAQDNPASMNPETRELHKRVRDLEAEVKEDEGEVQQMTTALQNKGKATDGLAEELELTKAELALHQEELDDAKQDLARGGDDAETKIQRMLSDHEAAEHSQQNSAGEAQRTTPFRAPSTLLEQIGLWRQLGKRLFYLDRAQQLALDYARRLTAEHNELEQRVKQTPSQSVDGKVSSDRAETMAALKRQADDRESLAEYDKRSEAQTQLAQVYGNWAGLVVTQRQAVVHAILLSLLWILLMVLVLVAADFAIDRFLLRGDGRRKRGPMRLVVRFVLQVVGVIGALFILLGRPSQLSTVLGLAGAGLTVALKDFIVGFFGWFVLMGKNGIRVGDWVEINGIGGEVIEIGLLRTVLLETGNWADSGHPTGRKVTFVNSYAIEGHYFNFSTAGQWLWDTLEILIPTGRAPYPITDAILKLVVKETEANAHEAEQEWQRATHEYGVQPFSATPSINVRPSFQGINVIVRYITRANQRYEVRAKLYEGVVNLLHESGAKAPA